jgi:hypothetical protein
VSTVRQRAPEVMTRVREQTLHQHKHWQFLTPLAAFRVIWLCSVYTVENWTGIMTATFIWAVGLLHAGHFHFKVSGHKSAKIMALFDVM